MNSNRFQLVCFLIINGENSIDGFGDTTKLFEAIGEDELKKKLESGFETDLSIINKSIYNTNRITNRDNQ